MNRRKMLHKVA